MTADETRNWLRSIADRAGGEAYQEREQAGTRADTEATARAWERLEEAADIIDARIARELTYPPATEAPVAV